MRAFNVCTLAAVLLLGVQGRTVHDEDNDRGLLDNILSSLRPGGLQSSGEKRPQSLVPTINLPNLNSERPPSFSLTNNPLHHLLDFSNLAEQKNLNMEWIKYALQECSKKNVRDLTTVLTSSVNNLRYPKIYYIQRDATQGLTWNDAQKACTSYGMNLVTINDDAEYQVVLELIKRAINGSTVATDKDSTNAFWIGLRNVEKSNPAVWNYVGDSTGNVIDWHTGEPETPATEFCVALSQRTTATNIHMDAKACEAIKFRYICEHSSACVGLLMATVKSKHFNIHKKPYDSSHQLTFDWSASN